MLDVTLKFSPKKKGNKEMILRGVRIYRPHDNSWSYFITNISADQLVAASCGYVYKLWVCEQLYKCAKSCTSLVRGINSIYLKRGAVFYRGLYLHNDLTNYNGCIHASSKWSLLVYA